ncbi:hypothetical protein [Halapricum desulfuricans]|uniref:Uncharacterized protein n=1 Tax=Halapricum desulfuricans TaxID=2841257 RepID=A0A897NRC9_9EURY|nr:hypothetical protein [Halapricum desulfuricans]QSG14984.1 hypothetical protein HSEST_1455 [Halapricum desulfuricans]
MPSSEQLRTHGDRNVVPEDVSPRTPTAETADGETEAKTGAPPVDAFTLAHMRAADREDIRSG